MKYDVTIKGIAPLLQHHYTSQEKKGKVGQRPLPPTEEAEKALYRDEKGVIFMPSLNILAAMRDAGANFPLKGRQTFRQLMCYGIDIAPENIPMKPQQWVTDVRPVVINTLPGRPRVLRARPKFEEWQLSFQIEIQDDRLSPQIIKEILEYTGVNVGIGDYRPLKNGRFGRFEVTKFEEA